MNTSHTTQPEKQVPPEQRRPTPSPPVSVGAKPGFKPDYPKDKPDYSQQGDKAIVAGTPDVNKPGITTDKKTQLKQKVEDRMGDLETAFASAYRHDAKGDIVTSLQKEIKVAQDIIGKGWEQLGDSECTQLTQWLQNTQYLADKDYGTLGTNGPAKTKDVPKKTPVKAKA